MDLPILPPWYFQLIVCRCQGELDDLRAQANLYSLINVSL